MPASCPAAHRGAWRRSCNRAPISSSPGAPGWTITSAPARWNPAARAPGSCPTGWRLPASPRPAHSFTSRCPNAIPIPHCTPPPSPCWTRWRRCPIGPRSICGGNSACWTSLASAWTSPPAPSPARPKGWPSSAHAPAAPSPPPPPAPGPTACFLCPPASPPARSARPTCPRPSPSPAISSPAHWPATPQNPRCRRPAPASSP